MATIIGDPTVYTTQSGPGSVGDILAYAVDAELITRAQYVWSDPITTISFPAALVVEVDMNFTIGDFIAPAGKVYKWQAALVAFLDDDFTGSYATSTPLFVQAPSVGPKTTPGTYNYDIGLNVVNLAAYSNSKIWLAIVPQRLEYTGGALTASTFPTNFDIALTRGFSFFTNRQPATPVITDPINNVTILAGDEFLIEWGINDPDSTNFGPFDNEFADQRGWQMQYRVQPTALNPTPTWANLQFHTTGGVYEDTTPCMFTGGWGMIGPSLLINQNSLLVYGGTDGIPNYRGLLPAGSWQVRMRTFDFGTPKPADAGEGWNPPTWATIADVNPSNTSPWSDSVNVRVIAPISPPLLISPVGDISVQLNDDVVLKYQVRDSRSPAGTQTNRSLRIRKGAEAWTDLVVNEATALTEYTVVGFTFESGFRYEWQAMVTSTGPYTSDWSQSGFFWVVPAPGSGGEIPLPADTVDLFQLGCGVHRVFVYERGGLRRIGEITEMTRVKWGRVRDDISEAEVLIAGWSQDCGELLAGLHSWMHELVIFRDSGQGMQRVWEGPITHITYEKDKVAVSARDVMAYVYRRILKVGFSDAYRLVNGVQQGLVPVTTRARRIIQDALGPADPNILAYLQVFEYDDDARQTRSIKGWTSTAFEVVDDMAAKSGLDYTAVGRRISVWDTHREIGKLPELRDGNFDSSPIVTEYGMLLATLYGVTDGNGLYGYALEGTPDLDTEPDFYSWVEMLVSTWTDGVSSDEGTLTFEGQQKVVEALTEQAERGIRSRYPTPVVVRIPDGSRLSPNVPLGINQLIPGVSVMLRSEATLRTVTQRQKLDRIDVVEEKGDEKVTITLSPFPTGVDPDAEEVEG